MEVHGPGGVDGVGRVPGVGAERIPKTPPKATTGGEPVDQVQISEEARLKSLLAKIPDVRQAEVDRVQAEIKGGTYETGEKIDVAIERLLDELNENIP